MSRSNTSATNVLHAFIEMVESGLGLVTHRFRRTGEGSKLPKGAVIKSRGTERLGENNP